MVFANCAYIASVTPFDYEISFYIIGITAGLGPLTSFIHFSVFHFNSSSVEYFC